MKKVFLALISIFMILSSSLLVSAADKPAVLFDRLDSAPIDEKNEILDLQDEIINYIASIETASGGKYNTSQLVIDFDRACKIFIDTNIFTLNTANLSTINFALENGVHIWILPVDTEEDTLLVEISKGLPLNPDAVDSLTAEKKAEIIRKEGQWGVYGLGVRPLGTDYTNIIQQIINGSADSVFGQKVFFTGGTPNMRFPVAVLANDGLATSVIALNKALEINEQPNTGAQPFRASEIQETFVYDFHAVTTTLEGLPEENGAGSSGTEVFNRIDAGYAEPINTTLLVVVIGGGFLVAFAICFFVFKKRRQNKN